MHPLLAFLYFLKLKAIKEDMILLPSFYNKDIGTITFTKEKECPIEDSKALVDMIIDKEATYEQVKKNVMHSFKDKSKYACSVGDDVTVHMPVDLKFSLDHLNYNGKPEFYDMLLELNRTWMKLSKKALDFPGSSIIQTNIPFFVAGDRFREFYYWDSFWILKGLLRLDMKESAMNIVKNMVFMIEKFGFVPNGARIYYTKRSQPPMLLHMMKAVIDHTSEFNEFILNEGLKAAIKEYKWFMENRSIKIKVDGEELVLNQFRAKSTHPRLESYKEDLKEYGKKSKEDKENHNNTDETEFYSNMASVAESGWDFSTRWFADDHNISSTNITDLIPVDLNAIIYRNEKLMSLFFELRKDKKHSKKFKKLAEKRKDAINIVLWNDSKKIWNDYNIKTKKHNEKRFYFSNIMPLVYGIKPKVSEKKVLKEYHKELFGFKGGVPVSEKHNSTQQWDYPNVWAPHQSMLVDYLLGRNHRLLAAHAARSFVENGYSGFKKNNVFYEKYNAESLGETGKGGEYTPQVGFGWTNGVLIDFILEFQKDFKEEYEFKDSYEDVMEYIEDLKG